MVHKVYLIGAGLGNEDMLTVRAKDAIAGADLLIGASRLLEPYRHAPVEKRELVKGGDIAAALRESNASCACVLFSGDVGFYSGAAQLRGLLGEADVEVIPGISSLGYFCAKIGVTWQDVRLVSAHGRACNIAGEVQTHEKTFFLTGGACKVEDACQALVSAGLGDARVWVGERLSYPDERIVCSSAAELAGAAFSDLAVMLVENERPIRAKTRVPALPDSAFVRGDVPMTKEEVRELAIAKLRLREDDVVWDVGAGTGSVCIEAAFAACKGSVYAVEKNETALDLLHANKERFGVTNLHIVEGSAPEALAGLPTPDRVFIGGSSGRLESIVKAAIAANPDVRICMTAIALETLSEMLACIERFALEDVDIAQVSIAKARNVAYYHMMSARNPVFLVSATARANERGERT